MNAASAVGVNVRPSGFPWEDVQYRWLATDEAFQWFAYGPTADAAHSDLEDLLAEVSA